MPDYFIGLMSGTSMDGIDAVIADFGDQSVTLVNTHQHKYPQELQQRLRTASLRPDKCGADELGELDTWVGECFRDAALALIGSSDIKDADIRAIGSHGQTLRHRPDARHRFTLQIGDPAIIASATGIDTVADFRRGDLALGGQGAPLTPPFHNWLFRAPDEHRVVANIGGIANVTVLPAGISAVTGFDTGPGNTLMDAWTRNHRDRPHDSGGEWAKSGTINVPVLNRLLADPWLRARPPKSTGVEYFNLDWLGQFDIERLSPADVQATLAEFTAVSIAHAISTWAPATTRVFVCGGGVHNHHLVERLTGHLGDAVLDSTAAAGLDPDWVEAAAFAWLAKRRIEGLPGNLPSVTGASRETLLGSVSAGRSRAST